MDFINSDDHNLWFALFANITLTVITVVAGLASGSLTLLSAASDNFIDSFSVVIGLTASRIGRREANNRKTYGYGRATLLGAMVNSSIALVLAIVLLVASYKRFMHPQPIHEGIVMLVAVIGLLINGWAAMRLSKGKTDLNKRAIYLDMLFDSLASFGVLLSGLLVALTHQPRFDAAIAAVLAVLLLFNAWKILADATHVLLDGVPSNIDFEKVTRDISSLKSVERIDDLHIWALSSTQSALSCHVVFDCTSLDEITRHIADIKKLLRSKHEITHSTIEPELVTHHHSSDH